MLFQDIHNSDFDKWKQFRQAVQDNDMITATAILEEYRNSAKILNAVVLNELFFVIDELQGISDDDFKADRIQTATSAPADLATGQIYFKVKS